MLLFGQRIGDHRIVLPPPRTVVRVLAEPDSVRYFVDGNRVGAWPRAALPVDGVYGFRIGRGANMHITNLDFTRRHAPFPARR